MTDTPQGMSKTAVGEMIDHDLDVRLKELRELAAQQANKSRKIEDVAMYVGLGQAALYGLGEFLIQMGLVKPHPGIPWMTIALFLGCILPKTVGRATAGKIWTGLGAAAAKRIEGGK